MHAGCGLLSFRTRCPLIRPITTWQGKSNMSNAGLRRVTNVKRSVNEEGTVYDKIKAVFTCMSFRAFLESLSCCRAASRPSVSRRRWRSMLPKPPKDSGLCDELASPTCRKQVTV